MRAASLVLAIAATAFAVGCGSKNPGTSVCDNTVPPPAACQTSCDPKPGAANTCPSGYHCAEDGFCDAVCTPTGNECGDGYKCTPDGRCVGEDACEGLECNVVDCVGQGKPETQIKGTVFAPNGTLPLYGITVYIPNQALPPLPDGAQCSRCSEDLPGLPLARAVTDEHGNFTISGNVPAGSDIPLVITSGKWRRQVKIPAVAACSDTSVPAELSRLPKNKTEGDIPKIALTTGTADSLECLIRKLGIDDSEITNGTGGGRVNFYAGNGKNKFISGWAGGSGATFSAAKDFWSSVDNLKQYDIVILSCEGAQNNDTKGQTALNAMKAYADLGGRVFASHWHNIWIGGYFATGEGGNANNPNPVIPQWRQVATWSQGSNLNSGLIDVIDQVNNPKGQSFANWMVNVMGSTVLGEVPIADTTGRTTANTLDTAKAERWTYVKGGGMQPQNFQFTTPAEAPADQKCGKVVFSDMHVSGGPGGGDYPMGCDNGVVKPLTPQEKALAFMLFDLASCVSVIL